MITKVESIPKFSSGRPRIYDVSAIHEYLASGFEYGCCELPKGLTADEERSWWMALRREGKKNGVKVAKRRSMIYMGRA